MHRTSGVGINGLKSILPRMSFSRLLLELDGSNYPRALCSDKEGFVPPGNDHALTVRGDHPVHNKA